jgi:hypothetical protein
MMEWNNHGAKNLMESNAGIRVQKQLQFYLDEHGLQKP